MKSLLLHSDTPRKEGTSSIFGPGNTLNVKGVGNDREGILCEKTLCQKKKKYRKGKKRTYVIR